MHSSVYSSVYSFRSGTLALLIVTLISSSARAQTSNDQAETTPPRNVTAASVEVPQDRLGRWLDVQNAALAVRYRYVDNSAGNVTVNVMQHRESLRGRIKLDAPGRYAINFGVASGLRFTSGWDSSGLGNTPVQGNLALKQLYGAVRPIKGVEVQYGGLFIVRGEASEITTYDDDGYITGERVSIRRPAQLFVDEIDATVAYLGDVTGVGINDRIGRLDEPNYRQLLMAKRVSGRLALSAGYTGFNGASIWRQAARIDTRVLHVADSIRLEVYERVRAQHAHGWAMTAAKAIDPGKKILVEGGYAAIDPYYGGLNADRIQIGNRGFAAVTYTPSPKVAVSAFVTNPVGHNVVLAQRRLCNVVLTYSLLRTQRSERRAARDTLAMPARAGF